MQTLHQLIGRASVGNTGIDSVGFGKRHRLISCLIRGGCSHICGIRLANWQLIDQLVNHGTIRSASQLF